MMMRYGALGDSVLIYNRLEMFEESVECLALSNRIHRAKEAAKKFLDKNETPRMLFLYGSLMEDPSYYQKAW